MSETCATCLHWQDVTSPELTHTDRGVRKTHPTLRGSETVLLMPGRWGICWKVDSPSPQSRAARFYVTDSIENWATLHTMETFGCIEHERGDDDE